MKLISLFLIPALLAAQDVPLSDAARKLLSKPRTGPAQLTRTDGQKTDGRVTRVTDQFVTFVPEDRPAGCENVELSGIANLHWLPAPHRRVSASEMGVAVLLAAFLAPVFVVAGITYPFQRLFPPAQTLQGKWESDGRAHPGIMTSLGFYGLRVQYQATTVKRGRYSVNGDRLRLTFDGAPDTESTFRFGCGELVLDKPYDKFSLRSQSNRATAPIVGEWHGSNANLTLRPDGTFEERSCETANGTYEMTAKGIAIHWPGREDWTALMKDRHVILTAGGVTIRYHRVLPGMWE